MAGNTNEIKMRPRFSVALKISLGFVLMVATLIMASAAGYISTNRLSTSLNYITGPAWDYKVGVVSDPSHRILLPTSMSINLILPPHVMYAVLKPSSGTEAAQSVTYK
jgi:hypothetical protein|tara:strand:- start:142429 stop:142752 length:324 start_codon:yes stop_codon:yes gene_type:complete